MFGRNVIAATGFVCVLGLPAVGRADAVTDCAKIQGKAFAIFLSNVTLAGGRACGKGSTGAPAVVSEGAVGAAAGKFYAAVGKSVDQFGPASCSFTLSGLNDPGVGADVESMLQIATGAAKAACLVPQEP
jgi:hypothetical protein